MYVLQSDDMKINRIIGDGRIFLRRPINQEFNPHYISWVVKHGGGSIMVLGCFSCNSFEPIHIIYISIKANEILT